MPISLSQKIQEFLSHPHVGIHTTEHKVVAGASIIAIIATYVPLFTFASPIDDFATAIQMMSDRGILSTPQTDQSIVQYATTDQVRTMIKKAKSSLSKSCSDPRYANLPGCTTLSALQPSNTPTSSSSRIETLRSLFDSVGISPASGVSGYTDVDGRISPDLVGYVKKARDIGCIDSVNVFRPYEQISQGELIKITACAVRYVTSTTPIDTSWIGNRNSTTQANTSMNSAPNTPSKSRETPTVIGLPTTVLNKPLSNQNNPLSQTGTSNGVTNALIANPYGSPYATTNYTPINYYNGYLPESSPDWTVSRDLFVGRNATIGGTLSSNGLVNSGTLTQNGNSTVNGSSQFNGNVAISGALSANSISTSSLSVPNSLTSTGNTMTSNVGGSVGTGNIINTSIISSSGNIITTSINGVTATGVLVNTHTISSSGNVLTSETNGVTTTGSIINTASLVSSGNTLTASINGVTATGDIITGNTLSLSGNLLTSIINTISTSIALLSDNVAEGTTNLYYTTARFVADFTARFQSAFDSAFSNKTTDNLTEGTGSLYFTNQRAQNAMSGTVSTLSGAINTLSGSLASLTTTVNTLSGVVAGNYATLSGSMANTNSNITSLSGTLSILTSSVNTLSGSLASLTNTINTVSGSLTTETTNRINADITLQNQINTVITNLSATNTNLATATGTISTLSGRTTINETNIATLSGSISTLSGQIVSVNSNLTTLSGSLSSLTSIVNSLSGTISSLQSQVSSLSGVVTLHTTQISTLSGSLANLQTQTASLSGQIVSVNSNLTTLSGSLSSLTTTVSTLSGIINTLSGQLQATNTNLAIAIGNIATLSGNLATTNTNLTTLSGVVATKVGLSALSAVGPLTYNSTTGVFGITQSSSTASGFLSAIDWNTFNSKIGLTSLSATGGISYNSGTGLFSDIFTFSGGLVRTGNSVGISSITRSQLSGFTTGQLTFGSATGGLTQSSGLFWDNTNGRLGVGTNTPSSPLTVNGNIELTGRFVLPALTNSTATPNFLIPSNNRITFGETYYPPNDTGTVVSFASASSSRNMTFAFGKTGLHTSFFSDNGSQTMIGTEGAIPIVFRNGVNYSATDISSSGYEIMRLAGNGNVGIGTTSPNAKLEINSGTGGLSGLRFTNLLSSSTPLTGNGKFLSVNSTGDVILTDATNAIGIGSSANGLTLSGTSLSLSLASSTTTGALSSTDWNTFNNKLNLTSLLTGFVSGSGTVAGTDNILQAFQKIQGSNTVQDENITNLSGNLASTNASLVSATGSIANLSGSLATTNSNLATINTNLSTLSGTVVSNFTNLSGSLATKIGLTSLSATGGISYNSGTGLFSWNGTTDRVTEGLSNLYYTTARFVADFTARFQSAFDSAFSNKTTDNLTEGTGSLYFTNQRAQNALSGTIDSINTNLSTATGNISTLSGTVAGNFSILSGSLATKIGLTSLSATGGISYNSGTGLFSDIFTFSGGLTRIGNSIGISSVTGAQLSGFTAGQLAFGTASGGLTQSSNLFWNNTNNQIGTTNAATFSLMANNISALSVGRRTDLGLHVPSGSMSIFPYNQPNNITTYIRGTSGVSALEFEASAASFFKPVFYTDADGNFKMRGSSAGTDFFELGSAGTNNDGRLEFIIGDDGTEPIVFTSNKWDGPVVNQEIFRLSRSASYFSVGNVGIGTTSPSAQLHTTGTVRFQNFGAGTLTTDASGNLSVSSDERLKDTQGNFTKGLSALENITPIAYKWNSTSGLETIGTYYGFSAQNVKESLPEAVGVDNRGYLTLSDRPILATLVNAVKELDQSKASTGSLEALSGSLATLSGQVALLSQSSGSISNTTVVNNYISSSSATGLIMSGTGQTATDALTTVQTQTPRSALSYITDMFTHAFEVVRDFVTLQITAVRGYFDEIWARTTHTETLCIGTAGNETCITKTQLDALLAGAAQSPAPSPAPIVPPASGSDPSSSSGSSSSGSDILSGSTTTPTSILGCMDSTATNYSSTATEDDGSCTAPVVVPDPVVVSDPVTSPEPTTGTGA